ncbi:hypothetical protein Nepgr_006592 [Nepenthes gracilis]|uniref:Uncharacterized protein n=1 Tax=Nepenthes gracilis TaxID=150966 RepID=A0AAD3XHG9_NEPGR|nr:hypothetical protein Nepgr_006592 [Nepenthes gracilis]
MLLKCYCFGMVVLVFGLGYQGASAAVRAGLRVDENKLIGGYDILSLAAVPGGCNPCSNGTSWHLSMCRKFVVGL